MSFLSGISSIQSQLTANLQTAGKSGDADEAKSIAGVMQNYAQNSQKIELVNMISTVNQDNGVKNLTEDLVTLQNSTKDNTISDVLENIDTTDASASDTTTDTGSVLDLLA